MYFPNGGRVNIEVHGKDKDYRMQWFDPDTFIFSDEKSILVKDSDTSEENNRLIILKTPTSGKTWLALIKDR